MHLPYNKKAKRATSGVHTNGLKNKKRNATGEPQKGAMQKNSSQKGAARTAFRTSFSVFACIERLKYLFLRFCAFCISVRRCVFVTSLYLALTVLFLYVFKADGFEEVLLYWEAAVSVLIFAVFGTKSEQQTKAHGKKSAALDTELSTNTGLQSAKTDGVNGTQNTNRVPNAAPGSQNEKNQTAARAATTAGNSAAVATATTDISQSTTYTEIDSETPNAKSARANTDIKAHAFIKGVCKVLLVLATTGGVLALLIQLGSSQRSLAEAWMEAARGGSPFGFFSFFAAEIYAVLLLPFVYAAAVRKHGIALCTLFAVNALCVAIIFASQLLLAAACIFVVLPILRGKKWQPFLLPLSTAAVCASLFAIGFVNQKFPETALSFDVSPLMSMVAPDFPLMVHIPGYGYTIGGTKPQNSVSLSPRVIYSVHGKPNQTFYFADNHLKNWTGESWNSFLRENLSVSFEDEEQTEPETAEAHGAETAHGESAPTAQTAQNAPTVNGKTEAVSGGEVTDVRVYFSSQRDSVINQNAATERLTLTLEDDFFSVIPLTSTTVAVELEDSYKESYFSRGGSDTISVVPSLTKGARISLITDTALSQKSAHKDAFADAAKTHAESTTGTPPSTQSEARAQTLTAETTHTPGADGEKTRYYIEETEQKTRSALLANAVSHISPKILSLSTELYAKAASETAAHTESALAPQAALPFAESPFSNQGEPVSAVTRALTEKRYIQAVLDYLKDGFTYALKSPSAPVDTDPFEYFLFTSKTGFCTWYAGAFTLLMQAADIPCRVAEGYRISTDQTGNAKISGTNAHAWAEVYIDGAWRIFEPTPIYTATDPFAFIKEGDRRTQKLVATALDTDYTETKTGITLRDIVRAPLFAKTVFPLIGALALILFALALSVRNSPVQRARKAVRYYRKKGVPSPEETGWLQWKESVSAYAVSESAKKNAQKTHGQNGTQAKAAKKAQNALDAADTLIARTYGNG